MSEPIEVRDGPAGPRAGLVGSGLEVWEVIATWQDNDNDESQTAEYLGVSVALVEAAVAYYTGHRDEIDAEIADNETAYRVGLAQWLRAGSDARGD